jgi:hypothetical protein
MPAISSSDSFVILVKIGPNLLRLGLSKSKTLQVLQQGKEKRDQAIKQGSLQPAAREGLFKDLLAAWQNANRICLKDASVSCYQNLIDAHTVLCPRMQTVLYRSVNCVWETLVVSLPV